MASMNLNTDDLPEPDSLEPVAAGEYLCEITDSDVAMIKSGKGQMLNLTMQVLNGPMAGRKIWDRINFQHSNEIAQKIGQQTVKAICKAVGFEGHLEDSTALHSVPLLVRVEIEDKDANYRPKNIVKGYRMAAQARPAPAQSQPAATAARPAPAAAPAKAAGAMPWKK